MGCSSSSTQTLAQENRPGVKAEEANGETLLTRNGIVAEDTETVSDQMQLPVQDTLLDGMGLGPETAEEVQAEAVSGSDAPLDPADALEAPSPEAPVEEQLEDAAAPELIDTTAAEKTLTAEPASELTSGEITPAPEPEPAEATAAPEVPETTAEEPDTAAAATPVEPAAVEEPTVEEVLPHVESTIALEPTPVEPVLNVESTPPQPPEPAPVELSPVAELTAPVTIPSAESAPAEDPTAPPELALPEPIPALEPTTALEPPSEEPSSTPVIEAAAIPQPAEENAICADTPTPAAQATDGAAGEDTQPDAVEIAADAAAVGEDGADLLKSTPPED